MYLNDVRIGGETHFPRVLRYAGQSKSLQRLSEQISRASVAGLLFFSIRSLLTPFSYPSDANGSGGTLSADGGLKVRPVRGRAVAFLPADLSGVVDHRLVWPQPWPRRVLQSACSPDRFSACKVV